MLILWRYPFRPRTVSRFLWRERRGRLLLRRHPPVIGRMLPRNQRGFDTLTFPGKIERFSPIFQRNFLGHNLVHFNPTIIKIIESAFERVNLGK
jgi:hypothetical protein